MGPIETNDERWMKIAIEKAREGVAAGQAPFGACIVRGKDLVVVAHNIMWQSNDITAHAEVTAIRQACVVRNSVDLSDCAIYSTTEPCPMCFSACHSARLGRIVYGATIADANSVGLSNLPISNEQMKQLGGSPIRLTPRLLREDCVALLREWQLRVSENQKIEPLQISRS